MKHLAHPTNLPQVDAAAKREWNHGWWAGMAVGMVNGLALAIVLGWVL